MLASHVTTIVPCVVLVSVILVSSRIRNFVMELQSDDSNVVSKSCTVSSEFDAIVSGNPTRSQKKPKLSNFNYIGA